MVHGIHAIGRDLHLEEHGVSPADEALNGNAGVREVFGQTNVIDVERDELAKPMGRNAHVS